MNNWQYGKWIYYSGRTIKNKSLSIKQRNAFVLFIQRIIQTRKYLRDKLNIKKGTTLNLQNQSDNSLGKMLQVIGTNIKTLPLNEQQKIYCDEFFNATDKRRFNTYKDYEINVSQIIINDDYSLSQIIQTIKSGDNILLQKGEYNVDLIISKDNITIKGKDDVDLNKGLTIKGNDVTVYGINVDTIIVQSQQQLKGITLKDVIIKSQQNGLKISGITSDLTIDNCQCTQILFDQKTQSVNVLNSTIKGELKFNNEVKDIVIKGNQIKSQSGIIFNGQMKGEIIIQGNK